MIGLSRIAMHIPAGRESVRTLMSALDAPRKEIYRFERIFELRDVAVLEQGGIEELLVGALADLAADESLADVGLVLYAHTIMPQVPPNHDLLGRVLAPFELAHLPSYGVGQLNCCALFRALELAATYVHRTPGRAVLVLAGDYAGLLPEMRLLPGSAVIGDAAVAFVVRADEGRYRRVSTAWHQDTTFHRGYYMDDDEVRAFNSVYLDRLREVIDECLAGAGMALDDVQHLCPHNANRLTWARFARAAGFPKERIFMDLIPDIAHTMTTDAFLNLQTAAERGRIAPGDRCLLVAVGAGSYFAATLLEVAA